MYGKIFRIFSFLALLALLALLLASGFDVQAKQNPAVNAQWPSQNVRFVGQIGGAITSVGFQGNYAYTIVGSRLVTMDVSDPALPDVIGQSDSLFDDVQSSMTVNGNYVYTTEWGEGLHIIDVSDPTAPTLVGSYGTLVFPEDVTVVGSYAYVAAYTYGLRIIDVSDPENPIEIGFYDTLGYAYSVAVSGSYAYVADSNYLRIVDISTPTNPSEVGFYNLSGGDVVDVAVAGNYAHIVGGGTLRIIDISDPANPSETGFYEPVGYSIRGIAVAGNYAYGSGEGLFIIDISVPSAPIETSFYDTPGSAYDVVVAGNYGYIVAGEDGLRIIDVSDPADPSEASSYKVPILARGVALVDDYAYVADSHNGLHIIDASNPAFPIEISYCDTPGEAHDVAVSGNYAYVVDVNGLRIIDVSDPVAPTLTGFYDTPGGAVDVTVAGDYAYVADWEYLRIIDVSDPAAPTLAGFYTISGGPVLGVAVAGNYAYLAAGWEGLHIIDISNPASPTEIGFYNTTGISRGVALTGNYAYVSDGDEGLRIIDISNPTAPTQIGYYDNTGDAHSVALSGDYAYLADGSLRVMDISNPSAPSEAGFYETPDTAMDVAIAGDYAYVADGYGGLVILQFVAGGAGPWYVAPNGDDGNDCLGPSTPCATINGVMDKASGGDTVYVASGIYTGTGDEVVLIDKDIKISGGWDESFTSQGSTSILDGEEARRGIFVNGGVNAYVDRFTVQHGYTGDGNGGGIYNQGTLILTDSTIDENYAYYSGYFGHGGGGIYNVGALTIKNSTISNNTATDGGGGIYATSGSSTFIMESRIFANKSNHWEGGGIQIHQGSDLRMSRSWVAGNAAQSNDAGGIGVNEGGTVHIENSIIAGNFTDGTGGGFWLSGGGSYQIVNAHIVGNQANGDGAAIAGYYAQVLLTNTLIVGNVGNTGIGSQWGSNSEFLLSHCDTYANSPDGTFGATITRVNCLGAPPEAGLDPRMVGGGLPSGVGPEFADLWMSYDYHLLPGSPAIDAGTTIGAPATDIEGNLRDALPDLGAYEMDYAHVEVSIDIKPGSDPNSINCKNPQGIIPVALLSTDTFDATSVDHTTVTFEGASEIHITNKTGLPQRHEEDVDKDGDIDLLFHFRYEDTNLRCTSTEGTLIGKTFDGQYIIGTDSIRITPPNYYTALLNAPGAVKLVATFGLLSAGLMLGWGLVLGFPMLIYKSRKRQ